MARKPDSGQLDLAEVFLTVQHEMLAHLAVGGLFEHPSAAGAATEQHWIELFNRYLPQRYRADPAESLIFFLIRLRDCLRAMGTAPTADLMPYTRGLKSFKKRRGKRSVPGSRVRG